VSNKSAYNFASEQMRPIKVGDCSIQEDNCVTFLGAVINKKLDWTDHVDQLEMDLCKRNGVIHRLTSYLPQHALLSLVKGFFSPNISYSYGRGAYPPDTSMEPVEEKCAWNRTVTPRLRHVGRTLRVRGASLAGRGAYPPGTSMESVEKKGRMEPVSQQTL
jgi:hypothetical protein